MGVKAEVERTNSNNHVLRVDDDDDGGGGGGGSSSWVHMAIEIPGFRDDDALPVFLAEMMRESLVVGGGSSSLSNDHDDGLKGRLVINQRWHWRLYIDVCVKVQGPFFLYLLNCLPAFFLVRFSSSPNRFHIHYHSSPSQRI